MSARQNSGKPNPYLSEAMKYEDVEREQIASRSAAIVHHSTISSTVHKVSANNQQLAHQTAALMSLLKISAN
jgi:adenylate kinase